MSKKKWAISCQLGKREFGGMEFIFFFMTNDPELALQAEGAGVERIGPDLEIIGKEGRQRNPDSRISKHSLEDISRIRRVLKKSEVFVRVNPIHAHSEEEIHRAIDLGAQVLMLPMFRTAKEVESFVSFVNGQAKTVLLLETPQAMMRLDEILSVKGIDEVHVGLYDLSIGLGLQSRFEVLCSELMDGLAQGIRQYNLSYGFGALARPFDSTLPIPPDQVIGEVIRLGASRASLSRYFFPKRGEVFNFIEEMNRLRERIAYWSSASMEILLKNRQQLRNAVRRYREENLTLNLEGV